MDKEYSAVIDGNNITFEFKDSLIHAEGEHAGNIDAIITTNPPLPQNLLLDELHIKVPGTDEYLYIYGYGVVENSLKATFNSSSLVDIKQLPEMVGVYWGANGEQFIGEMCCRKFTVQAESELAEEIDALEEIEESAESEATTVVKEEISDSVSGETGNLKYILIGVIVLIVIITVFIVL